MPDPSPDTPLDGTVLIPKDPEARARLAEMAGLTPEERDAVERWLERGGDRLMASPDTPSVCPTCGSDGWLPPEAWEGVASRCPACAPAAPESSSPDTAALVAELRAEIAECDDHPRYLCPVCAVEARCADALEAQAARITELEAAVAERNSLIGWLIMAKSCADHGQAPVWPLPAQLEELFQQLSVSMRDDWDDWRWRGITPPDHTLTTSTEETP